MNDPSRTIADADLNVPHHALILMIENVAMQHEFADVTLISSFE
jgi:hypothetical protein